MFVWKLLIRHSHHCHREHGAALAGLLTEAATHPGVMAGALLDTPGASTVSGEVAQELRRLNMLFTTDAVFNALT